MSNAVAEANQLLQRSDVSAAAQILQRAEQAGDALAARELGVWLLTGQMVRRNLAASRAMFERAAALGDSHSAAVTRAFVAGGVGGPADWPRALRLLRDAAPGDPESAAQLRLIEAMNLGPSGEPQSEWPCEVVSDEPEVRRFPKLFTPGECAYLIATAAPLLQPSVVIDPRTGARVANPVRTSSAAGFPFMSANPAIHALNRRLAAASGTDVRSGEPLQVLRYAPGEQYHEHSDALPGVPPSQQRVLTFLVWLDEGYEGGETAFPKLGIQVRGRTGHGLLFRNASADGTPDPRAIHAGLPVTSGAKHLASRWIRATPLIVE
ncbi:MAG: 2OG-Fe(II) oxygenase [Sphingomicrobium sp.]